LALRQKKLEKLGQANTISFCGYNNTIAGFKKSVVAGKSCAARSIDHGIFERGEMYAIY
jgi:hypothetical protein